mgnify:CR=1 FL=1
MVERVSSQHAEELANGSLQVELTGGSNLQSLVQHVFLTVFIDEVAPDVLGEVGGLPAYHAYGVGQGNTSVES